MGSRCELNIYAPTKSEANRVFRLARLEVQRFENKYTRFKPTSITSIINASAGSGTPVAVDSETAHLFNYADEIFTQSEGLFDITSGVLRKAWDFKSGRCPARQDLQALLPLIGWSKVIWAGSQITLPVKGMEIDLGGFVKEYAADVVSSLCLNNGVEHGYVNLGGDIKLVGSHPDGSPWKIGIQHPRKPKTAIATLSLHKGAVATSGDYERYMIVDGVRHSHLLDPKTGLSLPLNLAGVSVVSDFCLVAGSFSTLAMLMSNNNPNWLNDLQLPYIQIDTHMNVSGTLRPDI